MYLKVKEEFFNEKGVLISKKVTVKAGPSSGLSTVFFLHEGTTFKIKKQRELWTEIELDNGFSGWILKKDYWKI